MLFGYGAPTGEVLVEMTEPPDARLRFLHIGAAKLRPMPHLMPHSQSSRKERTSNAGYRSGHSQQQCEAIFHALGDALKRCARCGRMEAA